MLTNQNERRERMKEPEPSDLKNERDDGGGLEDNKSASSRIRTRSRAEVWLPVS